MVLTDSSLSVSRPATAALSEIWRSVSSRESGGGTEIGVETAVVTSVAANAEVTVSWMAKPEQSGATGNVDEVRATEVVTAADIVVADSLFSV